MELCFTVAAIAFCWAILAAADLLRNERNNRRVNRRLDELKKEGK